MATYTLSRTLTSAEAYRFACWAIVLLRAGATSSRDDRAGRAKHDVYQEALNGLLKAYPARTSGPEFHRIHARLSGEPDRAELSRYFRRVTALASTAETDTLGATSWYWEDVFDTWMGIAKGQLASRAATPPLRVDLLASGTPQQALAAFHRVPEGETPARGSEEEALIAAGLNFWIRGCVDSQAERDRRRPKDCACDTLAIHAWRPEDHLARCCQHPAWQRVASLQSALRFLGVATPSGPDLTPIFGPPSARERTPWLTERRDAEGLLEAWLDGEESLHADSQSPRRQAEAVLREAVRMAAPDAVPCPFCAAVVGMARLEAHLVACDAHPAVVAQRELQAAFDAQDPTASSAVLALAAEYQVLRQALRALVDACETFNSNQGWDGERVYSKAWCERPWLAALDQAEAIVAPRRSAPAAHPVVARLGAELAHLLASSRAYWSAGGDGSDRSYMNEAQDVIWRRDTAHATALLRDPTCTERGAP